MSSVEIQRSPGVQPQFAHESIEASERALHPIVVTPEQLPWLAATTELSTAVVTMADPTCPPILFASAVGTDKSLIKAANGMTESQNGNADNMFWSRIGDLVKHGYSSSIETMPEPATERPIFVMRNNGGQRVYFNFSHNDKGEAEVIRLAVCDKNRQALVLGRLSGKSENASRRKLSK